MFDISEKLITGRVNTISWESSSWKYLSLVEVISLSHTKVYVFSDSVFCFGKMNENPQSNYAWEDRLTWFKSSLEYSALDKIDGEPMEFEWNIFPGLTDFTGRIFFMSMFNDISWDPKTMKRNANQALSSFLSMQKDFQQEDGVPRTWIRKEMVFY